MKYKKEEYVWLLLRISMAFIFLWPFFDKLFGLGFATTPDKAWIAGNSPTYGFLAFGTHGPFAGFFQSLAGSAFVDWLFMMGLLLIGLALLLGIFTRLACYSGSLMLFLMWLALIPPEHNPFLDDHIIYALILIGIAITKTRKIYSLESLWSKLKLVKKYSILR